MVGHVGAGEMAHDEGEIEFVEQAALWAGELLDVGAGEAKSMHARIDVHGSAQAPPCRLAPGRPFADLIETRQTGAEVEPCVIGGCTRQKSVEDEDCCRWMREANDAGLGERRDKKGSAAFGGQCACDLVYAKAVGVSFDHAGAFGRAGCGIERSPVGPECRQVDGEHRPGIRRYGVGIANHGLGLHAGAIIARETAEAASSTGRATPAGEDGATGGLMVCLQLSGILADE